METDELSGLQCGGCRLEGVTTTTMTVVTMIAMKTEVEGVGVRGSLMLCRFQYE